MRIVSGRFFLFQFFFVCKLIFAVLIKKSKIEDIQFEMCVLKSFEMVNATGKHKLACQVDNLTRSMRSNDEIKSEEK